MPAPRRLNPTDLARAWEEALQHAWRTAGPVAAVPEEVVRRAVAPLVAPVGMMLEALEQSAAAIRTQAEAFDAAAQSFAQASTLLGAQASVLEHTLQALRDPTAALKATGAAALGIDRTPRDKPT